MVLFSPQRMEDALGSLIITVVCNCSITYHKDTIMCGMTH